MGWGFKAHWGRMRRALGDIDYWKKAAHLKTGEAGWESWKESFISRHGLTHDWTQSEGAGAVAGVVKKLGVIGELIAAGMAAQGQYLYERQNLWTPKEQRAYADEQLRVKRAADEEAAKHAEVQAGFAAERARQEALAKLRTEWAAAQSKAKAKDGSRPTTVGGFGETGLPALGRFAVVGGGLLAVAVLLGGRGE